MGLIKNISIKKPKGQWVKMEDREPPLVDKVYRVKMSQGSMNRRIVGMDSRWYEGGSGRWRFAGAFDWNYVVEWWEEY